MKIENEAQFQQVKKRKLLLNIISEALLIIGGILAIRPASSMTLPYIGAGLFFLGIIIGIVAAVIRNQKAYRKQEAAEEGVESFKQMTNEFGTGMVIMALIFLIALFIGGIFFLFIFSNSWIKAFFFFIAFELVTDLRDYLKLELSYNEN